MWEEGQLIKMLRSRIKKGHLVTIAVITQSVWGNLHSVQSSISLKSFFKITDKVKYPDVQVLEQKGGPAGECHV